MYDVAPFREFKIYGFVDTQLNSKDNSVGVIKKVPKPPRRTNRTLERLAEEIN